MAKYKKDSFSVTPNKKYLKGKKAAFQSIFFWLCDHADEDGICYPARTTIAKEAGVDIKTVDKYIPEMVSLGLLTKTSRTKKGTKEKDSNLYQIMIIEGEVAPKTGLGSPENGGTGSPENGAVTQPNGTQPNNTAETSSVWSWDVVRQDMMSKEGSDLDIIATFLVEKKITPDSKEQVTAYIKRYRKIAQDIRPFIGEDFEKFWKAVEMCKEESTRLGYNWDLSTVYKKITKI